MHALPPLSRTAHRMRLRDPLDLVQTHQRENQEFRWRADGNAQWRLNHAFQASMPTIRSTRPSVIIRARYTMAMVLIRTGGRLLSSPSGNGAVPGP